MKKVGKSLLFAVMLMALVLCGALLASCSGGCNTGRSKGCTHKDATFTIVKEATCTEDGSKHFDCEKCGKSWDETIEALGHDMKETVKDADCVTAGYKISNCLRCGITENERLDPLGHEWDTKGETVKGSCDKAGTTVYKCLHKGCEATKIDTVAAQGHVFEKKSGTAADCIHTGSEVFKCKNCTVEYTVVTPATGHTYAHEADCTHPSSACKVCGEGIKPALGHNFELQEDETVEVSCIHNGEEHYKCANCNEEYMKITAYATGHNENGVRDWTVFDYEEQDDVCVEIQHGTCPTCDATIERTVEREHVFTSKITQAATCEDTGTKKLTCMHCGSWHTETIPVDENAHLWRVVEAEQPSATAYVCEHNNQHSKTTANFSHTTSASLDNDILGKANDVALQDATIALDNGLKDLLGEINNLEVAANKLDASEASALLGDNLDLFQDAQVYDFTMEKDGTPVKDFGGNTVTVRIPYTLGEDEDPDSLMIWYINGTELVEQSATYMEIDGQGYAVLAAEHFSYYTVTRMSAADRCEKFGHAEKVITREATCTTNGYSITMCTRCGQTINRVDRPATGHDWEDTVERVANCTTAGHTEHRCNKCGAGYEVNVPALGHDWEIDLQPGDCTTPGKAVYTCKRKDCNESHDEVLPAAGHDYVMTVVPSTCQTAGHKHYECSVCGNEYNDDYKATTGHIWNVEAATCKEDKHCIVCNSVEETKLAHDYNEQHVCNMCGEGCEHEFIDKQTVPASCTAGGYTIQYCAICHYETRGKATPALGHSYNDGGVCSVCGAKRPANEAFYFNVLESLLSEKMTVTVENVTFNMEDVNYDFKGNVTSTSTTKVTQLEIAQLTYMLADDGSLYGAGNGKMRMEETYRGETETITADAKMILKDGYLYAMVGGTEGDKTHEMYVRVPCDFMFESIAAMNEELSGYQMFREIRKWIDSDLVAILNKVQDANGDKINTALDKFLGGLLPYTVSGSDYTLKINYNFILQVFDDVTTLSVSEFADKYVEEGFVESLAGKAEELLGKTVSQVFIDLGNAGLKKEDAFAAIDKLMGIVTGNTEFSCEKMLEQLAFIEKEDGSKRSIYQTKVNEILFFAVAQNTHNPDMDVNDAEQVAAFTEEIVGRIGMLAEQMREVTIIELVSSMHGGGEVKPDVPVNPGEDYDKPVMPDMPEKQANEGEEESPAVDVRAIFNKAIEELKKVCNIAIRADKDGHVKDVTVAIDNFTYTDSWTNSWDGSRNETTVVYGGKITYKPGEASAAAFEKTVIDGVTGALPKFTQNLTLKTPDGAQYSLTVDKNGFLVSATAETNRSSEYLRNKEQYNGIMCNVYEVREERRSASYEFIGGGAVTLEKSYCGDWAQYNATGMYESTGETVYYYEFRSVADDRVVYKTEEKRGDYNGYNGRQQREFTLYYNVKTKEFSAINPHNYELDEKNSTEPEGCEGVGHTYYVCKNCGDVRDESWVKGHNSRVKKVELLKPGTSCENGVLLTLVCDDCGKEVGQRKEYGHYTYAVKTIEFGKLGAACGGTADVYGCACGKSQQRLQMNRLCEFSCVESKRFDDANKFSRYVDVYTCARSDCGFTYVRDSYYTADKTDCRETHHEDYYFGVTFTGSGDPVEQYMTGKFRSKDTEKFSYLTGGYRHTTTSTEKKIPETLKNLSGGGYEITSGYRSTYTCRVCGVTYGHEERWTETYNAAKQLTKRVHTYTETHEDRSKHVRIEEYDGDGHHTKYRYEDYDNKGALYSAETTTYRKMNNYYVRSTEVREELRDGKLIETMKGEYDYPTDCCHYEVTYTYYDGRTSTQTGTNHVDWQHGQSETCTQGYYLICKACGEKEHHAGDYVDGHHWRRIEEHHYICDRCGLESEVPASGWIVLEDLTQHEAYGEKGFYTVGFAAQSKYGNAGLYVDEKTGMLAIGSNFGTFGIELSFMADGAEVMVNGEFAYEMFDVEKTVAANERGKRLIVINADAVEQYIRDNVQGDDIMLRVTFVPKNGDIGDYERSDYAITLDRYTEK